MSAQELTATLSYILQSAGLESLAPWVLEQQIAGKDELTIITDLRKQDLYKQRFPAMAELQRKAAAGTGLGVPINEGDYIKMERAYRQVFQAAGLPPTMWDTPDDYARLMASDISPVEVQRRVDAAKEAVNSTDPNVRQQLASLYDITATDLVAYALDPEKNSDYLQRIATTARVSGYGVTAGMSSLSRQQWESYAQDLINQQITDAGLREIIGNAEVVKEQQSRLASIEGSKFTDADAMDISVRKDAGKTMESQRRVEREKARWSAQSGVSSSSLAKPGI
jgi:hypothetical protein